MLKRETIIENVEKLSANELISKILENCENEGIDTQDYTIEITEGSLKIVSNDVYWPDDNGMWKTT